MKNFKKIGIVIAFLSIAVITYYATLGKKTTLNFKNPAFAEHIASYTAGVVNSNSAIRIILTSDAIDANLVGSEVSQKLFEFSPGINGKTIWLDTRTLEFQPDQRLDNGKTYDVSFLLSRVKEVSRDLATFEYSFQVMPQNFELTIENIRPYEKTQLTRQKIEGHLITADFSDSEITESILSASQDGNSLMISWNHTTDGRQHQFTVEDVTRKETGSQVNLSVNGNLIGVDHVLDEVVEIPALSDFKVMNVRVDQSTNQHVVLQFSDPLSETQNLRGLIRITDIPDLDYEIRDNEIKIYPPVRQTGTKVLTLEAGIRNILNYRMASGNSFDVEFERQKPQVRITGKGSILPATNGLILPFEAVNLKAVDVEVIKIYEENILQFLQTNSLDGGSELRRVARPMIKKKISLENSGVADLSKWSRFTLDLAELINSEPGAIYRIKIGFKRAYLAYECEGETALTEDLDEPASDDWSSPSGYESSYWDSYDDYYYDDYNWQERDNPCHSSFYVANKGVERNIIASDLGLLAKRGSDGSTLVVVNDIKTNAPIQGVNVEVYDFQQQLLGSATTGTDGTATIVSSISPFAIIAKSGSQKGYMRMVDGESLSLSNLT
ncbi:MAG: hypothetical protein HC811_04470 [Flammeovirgaceae bacterium]|nr:hypothetical protein [Flammeovirgaceae bacterium]